MLANEFHRGIERSAGAKDGCYALRLQECSILLRNRSSEDDENVIRATLLQHRRNAWDDDIVSARENAQPHAIHIFLKGSVDDHLRRLPQSRIDDLHARIAKSASNDLSTAVMSI